jgi:hypothetical protein
MREAIGNTEFERGDRMIGVDHSDLNDLSGLERDEAIEVTTGSSGCIILVFPFFPIAGMEVLILRMSCSEAEVERICVCFRRLLDDRPLEE